jgi:hypothetical protein
MKHILMFAPPLTVLRGGTWRASCCIVENYHLSGSCIRVIEAAPLEISGNLLEKSQLISQT